MKIQKFIIPALCLGGAAAMLTSCGYQQNVNGLLMKIFNSYTEEYQKDYWESIKEDELAHRKIHTNEGLICDDKCPTDAVLLWAYGPGYWNWNHYLHDGQESQLDDTQVSGYTTFPSVSDPFNKGENTKWSLQLKQYKLLDEALSKSRVSIPTHAYHGYESDETDMKNFINSNSGIEGFDFTTRTRQQAEAEGFKPECLVNKSYTDLGFMATALDVTSSMHWIETETGDHIIPFLEMDLDPEINGAYISYSNERFYDGFFLSWPWEYQLLCQRNLEISVYAARWAKSDTGKDLLWINCSVKPKPQPNNIK